MNRTALSTALLSALLLMAEGSRAEPTLPDKAKPVLGDQIRQHLGNRTFSFVVYDAGVQAYGTSTWDPQQETVHGDYVWGTRKGKWKKQWRVIGDKNCIGDGANGPWECQNIFVDGITHYEVRDDGVIHAINTPLAK